MHYAEKLRDKLTARTRKRAQELVESFSHASEEQHIPYQINVKEGGPSDEIVEALRYHDLLVIGNDPHFFYGHPDQTTTTLAHVVKKCVAPVIIVPDRYIEIESAILAFDGSLPAVRAMQRFAQMSPFGQNMEVHTVSICTKKHAAEAEMLAHHASEYLKTYGFDAYPATMIGGDPAHDILGYAEQKKAQLVIAGAHSVSKVRKLAFGSTTESLVNDRRFVLFLER